MEFLSLDTFCMEAGKALAKLQGRTGSSKHLLVAYLKVAKSNVLVHIQDHSSLFIQKTP